MLTNRFSVAAFLALSGLLLGTNLAQAQYSYFYGWYYPDEQKFLTFYEGEEYPQYNVTPRDFERFTRQPLITNEAPAFAYSPPVYYYQPAPMPATAGIEVMVPNAQAKVWFDGSRTVTTGIDRRYQTPALTPGTHSYQVKAAWDENGHEVIHQRTITVQPGQTTLVKFSD